jgi:hypothetical protein
MLLETVGFGTGNDGAPTAELRVISYWIDDPMEFEMTIISSVNGRPVVIIRVTYHVTGRSNVGTSWATTEITPHDQSICD